MFLKILTDFCAFRNDRLKMQIYFQMYTYNVETYISKIKQGNK